MGGSVTMTQATLNDLFRPWRRFPQILGFYALVWVVGAVTLTFIHITFQEKVMPPQAPSFDTKPTDDKRSPEAISNAWNAVQASNDVNKLNNFISRFPTSQYAEEARKRIDTLEQAEKMQVADAGASIQLVAQLLENKDTKPALLDEFISSRRFEKKYPLGFGLFYSDGRKTLYHSGKTNNDVQFDPSTIRVLQLTATNICFSGFVVKVKGIPLTMNNVRVGARVGSVFNFMRWQGVSISGESLGVSATGAAWIIGLAP
jgi:hypothetical protein